MKIELAGILEWGWTVFLVIFGLLWKELRRRSDVMQEHETRLAVLENSMNSTSDCLREIKDDLKYIRRALDAKADK